MKMKKFWKKFIARVLIAVMLVSVFSTVDMGWNVREVQAATETEISFHFYNDFKSYFDGNSNTVSLTKDGVTLTLKAGEGNLSLAGLYLSFTERYPQNITISAATNTGIITKVVIPRWGGYEAGTYEGGGPHKMDVSVPGGANTEAYLYPKGNGGYGLHVEHIYVYCHICNSSSCTKVNGQTAKCNIAGFKEAYKCDCGKYYSDSACKNKIADDDTAYNTWKTTGAGKTTVDHNDVYNSVNQPTRTITYKCDKGCNRTTTYKLNPNDCHDEIAYVNRNNYAVPTVTKSGDATQNAPAVRYKGINGTTYTDTTTKPTNTGNYQAYITMGSETVYCNFSIAPGGDIYKFNKGDSSATGSMSDQLVLELDWNNDTKLNPNAFSKTGYSFEKWTSGQGDFLDEANVRRPVLSAPWTLTLTAKWTPNDYTITFDNSDADVSPGTETATATYDAALPTITKPEKRCGVFQGYFTESNGAGTKIYDSNGAACIDKWTTPSNATLYAHWIINHDWGYEKKDNQVIATCQNEGCGFSQKMTLKAPDSVYNKNSNYNSADITNDAEFPQQRTKTDIQYEGTTAAGTSYDKSSTAPKDAGTYKATVTVTDDDGQNYVAEKSFTIEKAEQNATASVVDYIWGIDTLPTPEISGEEESATPTYYYNTENSNEGGKAWTDLTSVLLDNGTYYVYAELAETANYKAGKTAPTPFIITGKAFESKITKASFNGTYDKQPHTIDFSVDDDDPTLKITYATSADGTYSETIPTFTNAGDYTVYYRVKKFGYSLVSGSETVKIAKKTITITPEAGQSKSYGTLDPILKYNATPTLCLGDKFIGALTYEGAAVNADIGEYAIKMGTLSAGDNYELTLAGDVKFKITKATYNKGPAVGVGYTIDYEAETLAPVSEDFEIGKKDGKDINEIVGAPVILTTELSSKALRDMYYVRYKANSNQDSSPWTAITIPARPAAPKVIAGQETVKNKKDAEITGVNSTMEYRLDGTSEWTPITGNKIANPDNKNAAVRIKASNENKNFTGLEKNLIFTPSEVMLTVRMGDTVVEVPYDGTVHKDQRPQTNPVAPAGQVFMYWAFGGDEWKFDGESQTPDHVTKNITLVPVFGIEISGIITAQDYESITDVSLVNGKGNHYGHKELIDRGDGTYKYRVVAPAGVDYNLEIVGVKRRGETSHDITKTQLINLNHDGGGDVTMPNTVFSSKVNRDKGGAFKYTLVGDLDTLEDTHGSQAENVYVELAISDINNTTEGKTKDEIDAIKKTATNKAKFDFVDLTLNKKVGDGAAEDIGSTNEQLLEIIIPYNTAGKYNISVYRYHGNKVETLIPAKNIYGEYIEIGKDTITIHAMKFSTYAIGYSLKSPSSDPSNSNKPQGDDSDDSGSTPSGPSLPKKDTPAEKKPSDGLPKLIAKNTPKKDGNKEITDKNLLVSNTTGDEKDNPEKSEDVKDEPVVENDATQLEVGTSVPETEANKGSHRHHLLWLYLVLLILFCVARAITKEKANAVKISLLAGDVVVAGLLLFVVKICLLSVIVCLAEIAVATVIHLLIKSKNQTANAN